MNEATGIMANNMLGITIDSFLSSIMQRAQGKTIIMVTIDKKRVKSPAIIFAGKDL